MPRAPNEKVKQAQEMYRKGMKLIEIAQLLELPAGTVRRWKNTYQWDSERSEKKANVRKEKSKGSQEIDHSEKERIFEQLENSDLSDKQRLFCAYYLRTFNATKSYQKAYGCSYQTALTNGPALLGNTRIKNEIKELKKQRMERELLTEEDERRTGWIYTAAFGSEDIRREIERQFHILLKRVPLSVDAFSVDYRVMEWFGGIL